MINKNNYKIILLTIGFLLVGFVLAFYFENYYRQLVIFFFKFFNGEFIQFIGKNFHLFASFGFTISFGVFCALTFLFLKFSSRNKRWKRTLLTILIFFGTTALITAFDSTNFALGCSDCDDRIRKLPYNKITYDKYFIISLTVSILYLFIMFLLDRKKQKKFH
ncbi:MAG: hypothetical protein LBE82_07465 [Chitinophagaceae bacterium]|jgi:hypothetical protein|nr:hypothetical protein [Chitinophagaceae bacterium]